MRHVLIIGGLAAVLACGSAVGPAVQAEETASSLLIPQASLDDIDKKLDSIRQHQDETRSVSRQLDLILKNQEAMMAELQIIKIRATRR